jgi:enoyl-CoA hydratase/carnithine racemase
MVLDMSSQTDESARPPLTTAAVQTSEIVSEQSGSVLRIQFNRPAKKNALTANMYSTVADLINAAARDAGIRVVLLHGAGDSFTAGNDLQDFIKNPPGPGGSPQARLNDALINFRKPLVAAVHGAAVGSGTTMLLYCDFVYAGESARFQLPFINLGLVPEFGSSFLLPLRLGYIRAAELVLLGQPFDAAQAAALGLVTRVVPDQTLLAAANIPVSQSSTISYLGTGLPVGTHQLQAFYPGDNNFTSSASPRQHHQHLHVYRHQGHFLHRRFLYGWHCRHQRSGQS